MALLFRCSFVVIAAVVGIFLVARVDAAPAVPAGAFCSGEPEYAAIEAIVVGQVRGWEYRRDSAGEPVEIPAEVGASLRQTLRERGLAPLPPRVGSGVGASHGEPGLAWGALLVACLAVAALRARRG